MKEATQFNHNGSVYTINTIPAVKGLGMIKVLVKVLGSSITGYLSSDSEEQAMAAVVEGVVENMDKADIEKLILDMIQYVYKDSMAINFDKEFGANYGDLIVLIKEVFKHNFGSVFSLVGSVSE